MSNASLRHRPILGGVFGSGRYALATMPLVARGLHSVCYMVIEPRGGAVLSVADAKHEAIESARATLRAQARADQETNSEQGELWPLTQDAAAPARRRSPPRRRRVVFEKSRGRCHYCGRALTLDGQWHVEHMLPRALMGTDEISNLVAACVACNLEKRDRTALEFIAQKVATSSVVDAPQDDLPQRRPMRTDANGYNR